MVRRRTGKINPTEDPPGGEGSGDSTPSQQSDGHPRRALIFFIVSVALFMGSVDQTAVATALSTIQDELRGGIEWTSWTITIYALFQILTMPLAGKLSDMYGRKKVFVIAAVVFTVASLVCGLVDNIYVLVVFRALQAIGGGAFMPAATGIVSDHFGENRDRALGMFTSIFPIGGVVGPVVGGLIVSALNWRYIFFVNVPIGAILIVLAVVFIPAGATRTSKRLDVYGIVLLGALILSLMLGITMLGEPDVGLLDPRFLVPEIIAAIALALFVVRMRYASAPYIPLRLLTGPGFAVMNLINLLVGGAAMGVAALIPVYAQTRFGMAPLEAGSLVTARAIGMAAMAGVAVMLLRRTGYRPPMIIGFVVTAASLVGMGIVPDSLSSYLWLTAAGGLAGLGLGIALPATNNALLHLAADDIGSIAGLRGMFRQSGSILAISISTALAARSDDPGAVLGLCMLVFAGVLVCVIPLILFVPDHRGSW